MPVIFHEAKASTPFLEGIYKRVMSNVKIQSSNQIQMSNVKNHVAKTMSLRA